MNDASGRARMGDAAAERVATEIHSGLIQAGGYVVGATAVAYCFGHIVMSGFLGDIGAAWAMPLLSPVRIMQDSLLYAFLVLGFLANAFVSTRTSARATVLTTVLGVALTGVLAFFQDRAHWQAFAIMIAIFVFLFFMSYVLFHAKEKGRRVAAYLGLALGLFLMASMTGSYRARQALADDSRLPLVYVAGEQWRLVTTLNESSALLTQPPVTNAKRVFRVAQLSDISRIE